MENKVNEKYRLVKRLGCDSGIEHLPTWEA
jgi:hypothetical protein